MKVKVFVTGGTFDKEYNIKDGSLYFTHTHLPEILELGRCGLDIQIETIMLIDSLDMTDEHRDQILDKVKNEKFEKLVITHGTDTMAVTARFLKKHIKDKTVVLVGAMVPYKLGSSDALFNLGSALAFVQTLPNGVYITMNGRWFDPDYCEKNLASGRFEDTFSKANSYKESFA